MSQVLINRYLTELANLKKVGGTHRESVVREAFKDLLKSWGRSLDLTFIPEYEFETRTKERRYVDGALLHTLRVPFGYWEAKDSKDDLDTEIEKKFRAGYAYRPFVRLAFYDSSLFVDERGSVDKMFPLKIGQRNVVIAFIGDATEKPFSVLVCETAADLNFLSPAAAGTKLLPLHRYEGDNCVDNITDWALDQFKKHYQSGRGKKDRPITKEAIFHYVYGVLHDPVYREKYALNLKREFPRIPFYPDFWQWADWGRTLMDLHIGYESVEPCALRRTDTPDEKARKAGLPPKAVLRADKDAGVIRLDSETTLAGIPPEAWDYRLGNRSALEWILDQYKEKTPKDPTIREKFNTYRFMDYKEKVIDLLRRVSTVSVRTVAITSMMARAARDRAN